MPVLVETSNTSNHRESAKEDEDEIRSSADLIFAIDSFSNLVQYNQTINLDAEIEEDSDYTEDIIENDNDMDDICYTHTILLIGRCVVMCRDKIVEFCG